MENVEPINQIKLFGLDKYFKELVILDNKDKLPNKIMLSGPKGQGKSTLAYHFVNYALSNSTGKWLVFDIVIEGVSLVTNYRSQFSSQIKKSGIEDLLKQLSEKNNESN